MEENTSALKGKYVQPALGTNLYIAKGIYPPYACLQVSRRPR
jgi:hypothetical protein